MWQIHVLAFPGVSVEHSVLINRVSVYQINYVACFPRKESALLYLSRWNVLSSEKLWTYLRLLSMERISNAGDGSGFCIDMLASLLL